MLRDHESCARILLLCLILIFVCSLGKPALLQVNVVMPLTDDDSMAMLPTEVLMRDEVGDITLRIGSHIEASGSGARAMGGIEDAAEGAAAEGAEAAEAEGAIAEGAEAVGAEAEGAKAEGAEAEAVHEATTPVSVYEVVATGYYAGVESTGKSPGHPEYGITYSGVKVRRGAVSTIAADLELFPIGTVLYIPGYGYGVVADIGGAIKGNIIDLYFPSIEDIYREWGKRTVKVVVVEEGDGYLDEEKFRRLETIFSDRTPPSSVL